MFQPFRVKYNNDSTYLKFLNGIYLEGASPPIDRMVINSAWFYSALFVHDFFRFYAKLAELRQRIRANSVPNSLNKDLDSVQEDTNNLDSFTKTSTLPKTNRKPDLNTSSLPRSIKPRMQTVLESEQLNLEQEQEQRFKRDFF